MVLRAGNTVGAPVALLLAKLALDVVLVDVGAAMPPAHWASPPAHWLADASQVFDVAKPGRNTSTVLFLGAAASPDECLAACAALAPQRCWSLTWHGAGAPGGLAGQCFGLTSPRWNPVPVPASWGASSAWLEWPCRSDFDCSLNGQCAADGVCACNRAWRGARCETLALEPATRGAGFEPVDDGDNTTTWGGNVVPCGGALAGQFCMFVSEITRHCGIAAWAQNSRVVMATSATPGGAYTRSNVSWPVFSHEPAAVLAPGGEIALFLTASNPPRAPTCACTNGSTDPGDCGAENWGKYPNTPRATAAPRGGAERDSDPTLLTWAASADAEWSAPQQLFPGYRGADLNFSPLIFKNGSVLAMWRKWTGSGSRVFLATASDWRNASTYVQRKDELFPDLSTAGTEDQFLYQAPDGTFHAIFHHM